LNETIKRSSFRSMKWNAWHSVLAPKFAEWVFGTKLVVEIPMGNIIEAVSTLDNRVLAEAVEQLKSPEQFTDMLNKSSAADQLIEALSRLNLQQFQRRVERYQESSDPAEVERLRSEISRELFGN
jgi:hypothetical protein